MAIGDIPYQAITINRLILEINENRIITNSHKHTGYRLFIEF